MPVLKSRSRGITRESFEEQIEGHNPGDEFDIQVQFPDPYNPNPDMSGAVADFHIVLNSISVNKTPELTDEWVKENSEDSETVEEYREEIRASLEEEQEAAIDSELASSVQSALLEKIEVKSYPEEEVNKQIKQLTDTYAQMAEMYRRWRRCTAWRWMNSWRLICR